MLQSAAAATTYIKVPTRILMQTIFLIMLGSNGYHDGSAYTRRGTIKDSC